MEAVLELLACDIQTVFCIAWGALVTSVFFLG